MKADDFASIVNPGAKGGLILAGGRGRGHAELGTGREG